MPSMRQGLASKLLAMLGGAGLVIGICALRANAQATVPPPWTNANYANRYICNVSFTASVVPVLAKRSYFTAIMKLVPNGKGFFQGGTFEVPLTPFTGTIPTGNPSANFCSYSLDPSSLYTVNQDGAGGESLLFDGPATPVNPACPLTAMITASFVLRNNVTANNTAPRLDLTFDILTGVPTSGRGYCLK
jgi:hypothetical protein